MYRRILVPLDGSSLGEQVLAWVEILAKGTQARVELFRVYEPVPSEAADILRGIYPYDINMGLKRRAEGYLEGIAGPLRESGLSVSSTVREGDPASCISDEAATESESIIAMTTHGRSGMGRWLLGSVTDKVLHTTTNPLLMVRAYDQEHPPEAVKFETIIVPLDGSKLAEQALAHAISLAKALNLKVLLVRALPTMGEYQRYLEDYPLGGSATVYSKMYEEFSREADAQAMQYLDLVKQKLSLTGVRSVEEKLLKVRAADAIVELAQETPHSLVVLTTHGRSGVVRWALGSVTDRVVRHCESPVLVIRASE